MRCHQNGSSYPHVSKRRPSSLQHRLRSLFFIIPTTPPGFVWSRFVTGNYVSYQGQHMGSVEQVSTHSMARWLAINLVPYSCQAQAPQPLLFRVESSRFCSGSLTCFWNHSPKGSAIFYVQESGGSFCHPGPASYHWPRIPRILLSQ